MAVGKARAALRPWGPFRATTCSSVVTSGLSLPIPRFPPLSHEGGRSLRTVPERRRLQVCVETERVLKAWNLRAAGGWETPGWSPGQRCPVTWRARHRDCGPRCPRVGSGGFVGGPAPRLCGGPAPSLNVPHDAAEPGISQPLTSQVRPS